MPEMRLPEAAAALGVSVDTIRRRVKRGELAHHTDGQGRIVVHLGDAAVQVPSNGHGAAEHLPSAAVQAAEQLLGIAEQTAEHAAEHVAGQRLAAAEQAAGQARLEGIQAQLDAAQSEVSFLRDELRRRDELAEREREQHQAEREALHARLHEALAALALQRALPSGEPPAAAVPQAAPEPPRPWWARWAWWR
jgi:excisionase family DNA binding protein